MSAGHLSVLTAFIAGLVSFVSPCVLPLIPAYLCLLTGSSFAELSVSAAGINRARIFGHAVAFVSGFTVIFVILGVLSSAAGGLLAENRIWLARVGGLFIIILGLNMTGVLRLPWLAMDKRVHLVKMNRSYPASALVGMAFAAGWSPCIGPILSSILLMASQQHLTAATGYMLAYSAGLAAPFLAVSLAFETSMSLLARLKRFLGAIEFTAGAVLVLAGCVIATDSFLRIAGWFYAFAPVPKL